MQNDNPYEPPKIEEPKADIRADRDDSSQVSEDKKIARYAQLGLRLIGVMFVVQGIASLLFSATYWAMHKAVLHSEGIESTPDVYSTSNFMFGAAYLFSGLYLVLGGRWLIETVFLPVGETVKVMREAE